MLDDVVSVGGSTRPTPCAISRRAASEFPPPARLELGFRRGGEKTGAAESIRFGSKVDIVSFDDRPAPRVATSRKSPKNT